MIHEDSNDHTANLGRQQVAWAQVCQYLKHDPRYAGLWRLEQVRDSLNLEAPTPGKYTAKGLLGLCLTYADSNLFDLFFNHFELPKVLTFGSDFSNAGQVKDKLIAKLHAPNCPVSEVEVEYDPHGDQAWVNILKSNGSISTLSIETEAEGSNNAVIVI